ncbi:autotransporter outer membrane beta-barrel domain-containing protein [Kaarinaea lacus]
MVAQSNDDVFEQFIRDTCIDPPPELIETCANALAPGPKVANSGVVGGAGASSNAAAYLKRKSIEKRDEEEESSGAGASADFDLGKLSLFTNFSYLDGERDKTILENGFDTSQYGLTAGADYRINNKLFAGGAIGFTQAEMSFKNDSGSLDTDNLAVTFFGNYLFNNSITLDGYFGAASLSYDSTRRVTFGLIQEDAVASYDGKQYSIGATANYTYYYRAWSITGVGKLDYVNTETDSYSESGGGGLNLIYTSQTIESFTAKLGVNATYAWSQSWGVLMPQARLHYVHEFLNDGRTVTTALVLSPQSSVDLKTDDPDRDYLIGGLGASMVLPGGMQTFVDLEFLTGHSYISSWTATAGVRWEL